MTTAARIGVAATWTVVLAALAGMSCTGNETARGWNAGASARTRLLGGGSSTGVSGTVVTDDALLDGVRSDIGSSGCGSG